MAAHTDFIGRGVAFPARVDGLGRIALFGGDASVEAAVALILSTAPGERVMRPEFGCRIWELAFGGVETTTLGLMAHYTRQALARWEPRIEVQQVTAEVDHAEPTLVRIEVAYLVRATNDRRNLVFPFYVIPG